MYHGKYQCNWSLQLAGPGPNQPGISSGGSGQENIADRKFAHSLIARCQKVTTFLILLRQGERWWSYQSRKPSDLLLHS